MSPVSDRAKLVRMPTVPCAPPVSVLGKSIIFAMKVSVCDTTCIIVALLAILVMYGCIVESLQNSCDNDDESLCDPISNESVVTTAKKRHNYQLVNHDTAAGTVFAIVAAISVLYLEWRCGGHLAIRAAHCVLR